MTFQTRILDLAAGPVDLVAVAAFGIVTDTERTRIFFQNIGETEVRYSEQTAEPAITDAGHILGPRDGLVAALFASDNAWVWTPTAAGEIAVSPVFD